MIACGCEGLPRGIHQSCHLAVASGDQMVVIAMAEAPGDLGFSVRIGYRIALRLICLRAGFVRISTRVGQDGGVEGAPCCGSQSPGVGCFRASRTRGARGRLREGVESTAVDGVIDLSGAGG